MMGGRLSGSDCLLRKALASMSVEQHLLFAVLAFEDDLIDLQQLTAACRAWAGDKSKPLADLLVERGWVTAEHRRFLEEKAERKLARHQNDPRVTLNAVTRGDVCDALLKEVDDSEVRQSLSSWPSDAPVLLETIGETLDESQKPKTRYTWVSEVGAGGLGKVWLARDNDLSREVALKEIKPGSASSEAVRRLIKEAQITGQLQHPGIVPVYEVSREGRPFYTMKLVRGETLSQAIREHHEQKQAGNEDPLSERLLLNVFLNICDAIAYAHSRGVIHRDLKPDNIVLGEYGEAIVLDWGLARQVGSDDEDSTPIVVTEAGRTDTTQAGQKLGTPAYMAPEQAAGRVEHMDERTDIYGLGAILFEVLTGRPPHQRATTDSATSGMAALLHRIATGETPRVRSIDESIADELDAICATAMAEHREERYQAAKDLKAALLKFQVHEESIDLAARADDDLAAARQSNNYDDFSRARFGFDTALEQWPENIRAADGLRETRHDYACAAFDRGDFDLALSLLDTADPGLATTIQAAVEERASRTARIRGLRRVSVGLVALILVIICSATYAVNQQRIAAELAKDEAVAAKDAAVESEKAAVRAEKEAVAAKEAEAVERKKAEALAIAEAKAKDDAVKAEMAAVSAQMQEVVQREKAEALAVAETKAKDDAVKAEMAAVSAQLQEVVQRKKAEALAIAEAKAKDDAVKAEMDARRSLKIAERNAYNSDMLLVQRDWEDSNIEHPLELLDKHRDRDDLKGFEWGYWDRQSKSDLQTLKGHTDAVLSVAFSPDGQRLASGGGNWDEPGEPGEVKVWDAITGQESLTLKGHTSYVTSVAFSPDGQQLASASGDKTVKVWDAATGQESLTLKGHTGEVYSVVFSPDGQRLASGGGDWGEPGEVKVWDAATGQESLTLKGHTGTVRSVAFSPDGQRLASAGGEHDKPGEVKVWDAATGQESLTLKGHTDRVSSVVFSPDGQRLASGGGDLGEPGEVKVWDAATGQESLTLKGHTGFVSSVAFSMDGQRLASAGGEIDRPGEVKVWDTATGQQSFTLKGHTDFVFSVAFSPDGQRLASAGGSDEHRERGEVKLWDATTGWESLTLKGHTGTVRSVAFSPDGQRLASAGDELYKPGEVKVWDAATGQESLTLKGHTREVNSVAFSPDGQRLASASADNTVKVWDVATGKESLTLTGHISGVSSVAFSPDGQRLASGGYYGDVKVWDAVTGRGLLTLRGHTDMVYSVAFSPDGQRLASAGGSGAEPDKPDEVKVWDAVTGRESLTLKGHAGRVYSVVFSPDGQRLASASYDKSVKVWDAATGQESLTLKGHKHGVNSVAFSPDGQRLASACLDGTVKVWDAATGKESLTLKGHAGSVYSVAFGPDGQRLASASTDGTVKVWDARPWTPELRAQFQARGLLTVKRERVKSLEELQAVIRSDKTISDMVRKQALDWAELFWRNRESDQD